MELPVVMSPVVVAAAVIADEGACIACREAPDGLLAAAGGALASGGEARLGTPFLVSAARLGASLAEDPSTRCAAD